MTQCFDMTHKMILTPFIKAVRSLEEILQQEKTVIVRDATIQRFEYTFELAIRMLQRYFKEKTVPKMNMEAVTYNELCRMAAEAELIDHPGAWFKYRDARNISSHAYDEEKAEEVYQAVKKFLPDAKRLLEQLEKRV